MRTRYQVPRTGFAITTAMGTELRAGWRVGRSSVLTPESALLLLAAAAEPNLANVAWPSSDGPATAVGWPRREPRLDHPATGLSQCAPQRVGRRTQRLLHHKNPDHSETGAADAVHVSRWLPPRRIGVPGQFKQPPLLQSNEDGIEGARCQAEFPARSYPWRQRAGSAARACRTPKACGDMRRRPCTSPARRLSPTLAISPQIRASACMLLYSR